MSGGTILRTPQSIRVLMLQVLAALTPALVAAVWRYGTQGATVIAMAIGGALVAEAACSRRAPTDGSAAVTGAIVALVLPASAPWWLAGLAGVIAIALGKYAFGGLGNNVFNPAAMSRAVLMGVFPAYFFAPSWTIDTVSMATPLSKEAGMVAPELSQVVFGELPGAIGQAAPLAVLAGGLLLVALRTIDWRIPVVYFAGICALAILLPAGPRLVGHTPWLEGNPLLQLTAGGTLIVGFFMLTDPVTAPFTPLGRVVFALLAAAFTIVPRYYTPYPDSAALAVLLANVCTPLIDRITVRTTLTHRTPTLPKSARMLSLDG
jgi:electron transport complex protein RnfD